MGEQVDSSFFEVFQWIGGIAEEGLGAFVFQFFRPLHAVARLAAVVCSYWLLGSVLGRLSSRATPRGPLSTFF